MAREELCSMKRCERERPRQHKKPGKSRHGVGREDGANACREDNCCKEGELRWRVGGAEG